MLRKTSYRLVAVAIIFSMLAMAGCATTIERKTVKTIEPPPAEIASSDGWWYARFRMQWPQEEEPSWHTDLLMAHKGVAPVLLKYKGTAVP